MDKGYSIYAIIRQSNSNQLRLIEKRACLNRTLSLNDYKQYHDYAVDLYRSYCSCIPWNTGINRIDQLTLGERDAREKAFAFEDTLSQMKNDYDVVAYSHRKGGFKSFVWHFNDDIKIVVYTSFGYGSSSSFEQSFYYKGMRLTPYSHLIRFRYANYSQITQYTYAYSFEYSEWKVLLQDSLDFYNALISGADHYIFSWITNHLEKMTKGLEDYLAAKYVYFDNKKCVNNYGYIHYETVKEKVEGDELWVVKSGKIADSLKFIDSINALPAQVCSKKYVERIINVSNSFLPMLEAKLTELNTEIEELDKYIEQIHSDGNFALYQRICKKYVNKYPKMRFFVSLLHRKGLCVNDVRTEIANTADLVRKEQGLSSDRKAKMNLRDILDNNMNSIKTYFDKNRDQLDI